MAISSKPKPPQPIASPQSDVDVEALINKGLAIHKEEPKKLEAVKEVLMRIPTNMADRLDSAIKARPIRIPRHSWILEAILEKLEREGQ